jgi:hypothetical protein
MQYWEEMNDKYGFGDGGAYPAGIELYRDVYLKVVNKLAENRNSELRIVPFDRGGVHNYCLWMVVPKEWFETVFLPKQKPGAQWEGVDFKDIPDANDPEPEPDDELEAAIEDAMGMDLDSFVEVNPVLAEGFGEFLAKM